MIEYQALFSALVQRGAHVWAEQLQLQLMQAFSPEAHGDLLRWRKIVDDLPVNIASSVDLLNLMRVGCPGDINAEQRLRLTELLMGLHPWRKGPYKLFGIDLDTEWRSDWKWARLQEHIAPLNERWVLDVGCGNGYHCWRMLGAGAKRVIGIDPTLLSVMQFQSIKKLYGEAAIDVLPIGIEDLPADLQLFDTVFSMGVLYHRRSPIDHLFELKSCLRPGGELVLETLVIDGDAQQVLVPGPRYAQMRNVWFLPSCDALLGWMARCGFKDIRLVDVCKTTPHEQRSTDWMRFHSLSNFLDPDNPNLTIEGYPAPARAIVIARID